MAQAKVDGGADHGGEVEAAFGGHHGEVEEAAGILGEEVWWQAGGFAAEDEDVSLGEGGGVEAVLGFGREEPGATVMKVGGKGIP